MGDVIAAIATGKQVSAIGIIRVSGEGCAPVCDKVFRAASGRPLSEADSRRLVLGSLLDCGGRVIDQVLAVYSRGPRSYTGEDTVEFQCHGSPAVLSGGLEALLAAGARQAGPGEFTKRAFLNGRMDLTQAEAVVDLIDAESTDAAANAAGQLGGALLRRIDPVYGSLRDMMSHFHAVLDYPDEDIAPFELENYLSDLTAARAELAALLASYRRGQLVKRGIRTVILGKPNVGKSSLLNLLAGYERVIVTDIAGTTRDSVEESVRLGRHLLRLVDTAGIHETEDRIERMGVDRARAAVRDADLVLTVLDASAPMTAEDREAWELAGLCPNRITLYNKIDLGREAAAGGGSSIPAQPGTLPPDGEKGACGRVIDFSAKTGEGLEELERELDRLFGDEIPCDGSLLSNTRQAGAIRRAGDALDRALQALEAGITPDAVLCDVENAMEALGEVTGRTFREDIVNRIFERFCVGK